MSKRLLILLSLSFLVCFHLPAQEKAPKKVRSAVRDTTIVLGKGRLVVNNKIYRENSSYLTLGYGAGFGYQSGLIEQNLNLSYQHFFKKVGLQVGYHTSSDMKVWWRSYQKLNDVFLGGGYRLEGIRYNLGVFAGPSYAYGSYIAWNEERQKEWAYGFNTLGFHAELLATYKITYDIGAGLSLYSSINRFYTVAGAQIHLFFSTAFVRNYD